MGKLQELKAELDGTGIDAQLLTLTQTQIGATPIFHEFGGTIAADCLRRRALGY